jgi:hypothetical protein
MTANDSNIFVQIPSYRDSQLVDTVDSLIRNAYNKQGLRISICWQHSKSEKLPKKILDNDQIHIIDINFKQSEGANWARSIIQKNWNGEKFTLLIDSHTRLVKDWDKKLIEMYLSLKQVGVKKPILTGYPPSFNPGNYPKSRLNYPLKMYVEGYYYNLLTKFNGRPIPYYKRLDFPIPGHFIALGLLFTEGLFNQEIKFDPSIYFYGDEITTGLRAYCHGYDFYHPHRVIAWHLYDRKTRITHWETHANWKYLDSNSCNRIFRIFKGEELANFPLGVVRSISDYEDFIGYNLILDEKNNRSY